MPTITPTSLPEENWQYAEKFNPHTQVNDFTMNNQNQFYTITLTGVIQLLSKCSVFSFSGGKRAPTEESNKMCKCTIANCMKLGPSEHLGGVTFPFGL